MIVINYNNAESDGKSIEELLDMHYIDIAREIINVICEAIDNEIDMVCAVEIRTPRMVYSFTSTFSSYIETLKKNIEIMVIVEEYELCAKAMKHIKKLENKTTSKKLLVDSKK